MKTVLEARQVSKIFGGLVAVNKVDLIVPEGSIASIIGPNGAGKTTLFNCISGFYTPELGDVLFNGRKIQGMLTDFAADKNANSPHRWDHGRISKATSGNGFSHPTKIGCTNASEQGGMHTQCKADESSVNTRDFPSQALPRQLRTNCYEPPSILFTMDCLFSLDMGSTSHRRTMTHQFLRWRRR